MYMMAGQGDYGAEIYREENCRDGNFLTLPEDKREKIKALMKAIAEGSKEPIMKTPFIEECMRRRRPINLENMRKNQTDVYAMVLNADTVQSEFIDLKTAQDPIAIIGGAICVLGVSSIPWREVDGKKYIDGAYIDPIPLEKVFEMGYNDVLVIANNNFADARRPFGRSPANTHDADRKGK